MSENHNLVADFYDQLAPYYSLIFPDWRKSISFQADVLDRLIKQYIPQPSSLNTSIASHPLFLDCACGIGTHIEISGAEDGAPSGAVWRDWLLSVVPHCRFQSAH